MLFSLKMKNMCSIGPKNEYSTAIRIHHLLADLFYFKLDDSNSFRNILKSNGENQSSTGEKITYISYLDDFFSKVLISSAGSCKKESLKSFYSSAHDRMHLGK